MRTITRGLVVPVVLLLGLADLAEATQAFSQHVRPELGRTTGRAGPTHGAADGQRRATAGAATRIRLSVRPLRPHVGESFLLQVADPPGLAADFRWDLSGRGTYSVDTGRRSSISAVLLTPGTHPVGVRVTDGAATQTATLMVTVRRDVTRPSKRDTTSRSSGHGASDNPGRGTRSSRQAPGSGESKPRLVSPSDVGTRGTIHHALVAFAAAAGDPGVAIRDFSFGPGTATITVGQTITWTNNGPSAHTATATDGSFDTGVLRPGQSASHTFTHSGTFSYVCQIHPFMHGTVVVLASGAASASSGAPTSGTTPTSGSGSAGTPASEGSSHPAVRAASAQTLPFTGYDLAASVLAALALIGGGSALRVLVRHRTPDA